MDSLHFIEIKSFFSSKDTIKQTRQATPRRKYSYSMHLIQDSYPEYINNIYNSLPNILIMQNIQTDS